MAVAAATAVVVDAGNFRAIQKDPLASAGGFFCAQSTAARATARTGFCGSGRLLRDVPGYSKIRVGVR
jgi:hypothetical protein